MKEFKMTLYNYLSLMPDGEELTVWDKDYDIETYFYSKADKLDNWDKSIIELSKLLTIAEIRADGVIVNLAEIIEANISKLKKTDLFIYCNIVDIMDDIDNILAGYVSEEWLEEFVKVLTS